MDIQPQIWLLLLVINGHGSMKIYILHLVAKVLVIISKSMLIKWKLQLNISIVYSLKRIDRISLAHLDMLRYLWPLRLTFEILMCVSKQQKHTYWEDCLTMSNKIQMLSLDFCSLVDHHPHSELLTANSYIENMVKTNP